MAHTALPKNKLILSKKCEGLGLNGIQLKLMIGTTLVKSSRIYTGQYTFPIWLLNDDNMLGEHKGGEKSIAYGRLF